MAIQNFLECYRVKLVQIAFDGEPTEHTGWAEFNPTVGHNFILVTNNEGETFNLGVVTKLLPNTSGRILFEVGETIYELVFPAKKKSP